MDNRQIHIFKNNSERIVKYDMDETITAKIENFKDKPAVLTLIEHIAGEWEMDECNMEYEKKDANTLKFEITLHGRTYKGPAVKNLKMRYQRLNIRP